MRLAEQVNNFLKHYQYNHGLINAISTPSVFAIESTNICNLNCRMCSRCNMKRPVGMMDFNLFKKIIDQTKGITGFVLLHGMGEPLFHPKIIEMINYCEDNGIRAGLSTNATLLDEKTAEKLVGSKLSEITLCMDGATRKTYEKTRRGAHYDQVRKNIRRFLEIKKERGNKRMKAIVQLIQMDETEKEKKRFIEEWETNADVVFFKKFSTWADQVEGVKKLAGIEKRYKKELEETRPPCFLPWQSVMVYWDGKVVPCCIDFDAKMTLGDANKQSLAEIWNGEPIKKLRKMHIERKFGGVCRNCAEYYAYSTSKWYPFNGGLVTQIAKKLGKKGRLE